MRRSHRSLLAAAVALCLANAVPSAHASIIPDSGTGEIVLGGVYFPPVGAVPNPSGFALAGTLTGVVTSPVRVPASVPCNGGGNGLESYAEGFGTIALTCGDVAMPVGVYVRVGLYEVVALENPDIGAGAVLFGWVPGASPPGPVDTFTLTGLGSMAD